MSRILGGKKGIPPTQAVLSHLLQQGTLSDSLQQDTTFDGGPGELLKHKEKNVRDYLSLIQTWSFLPFVFLHLL
jgi:hypothetical protein